MKYSSNWSSRNSNLFFPAITATIKYVYLTDVQSPNQWLDLHSHWGLLVTCLLSLPVARQTSAVSSVLMILIHCCFSSVQVLDTSFECVVSECGIRCSHWHFRNVGHLVFLFPALPLTPVGPLMLYFLQHTLVWSSKLFSEQLLCSLVSGNDYLCTFFCISGKIMNHIRTKLM